VITEDGWLDWAVRVPGPPDKVSSGTNPAMGYVPHSAVGFYGGWADRLFSTDRRPDGRYTPYAAASVHGWIAYNGAVTQHYPFTASCWASGSTFPNSNFVAFENEGGFDPHDEPLTPAQISANARIIRELAAWRGWTGLRRPKNEHDTSGNLYEHCECVRWGSLPTACPSKRIPWDDILAEVDGGSVPKPEPVARTAAVIQDDGTIVMMDIDEYAKGVLPYEMATGWPMEALKAQAVVAKSYAIAAGVVHTDTRSQVYGPLRFRDTDDAVEAVKGIYLAKDNQIVMPFYFGHCNGRTRSPSEAGWNPVADRSFLQGTECPCGRTSYFGHGIGMCQRGAQALAKGGKKFEQILRHYYRDIELLGFGKKPPSPRPANALLYTVKRGDSLAKIARAFGLEWEAIYLANRDLITDPNKLKTGWELVIPNGTTEEGMPEFYVVQPGDTLFSLSRKWDCTVADIARLNSLADERMIGVGLRLQIPK
jgi:nucleoid-associated protein YgaU